MREVNSADSLEEFNYLKTRLQQHIIQCFGGSGCPMQVQSYTLAVQDFVYGARNQLNEVRLRRKGHQVAAHLSRPTRIYTQDKFAQSHKHSRNCLFEPETPKPGRPPKRSISVYCTSEPANKRAKINDHDYDNANVHVRRARSPSGSSTDSDEDLLPRDAFQAEILSPEPSTSSRRAGVTGNNGTGDTANDAAATEKKTKTFGLKSTIEMFSTQMDLLKKERDALLTRLDAVRKRSEELAHQPPTLRLEYQHFGVHVLEVGEHLALLYTGLPSVFVFNWLFSLVEAKAQALPPFARTQPVSVVNTLASSHVVLKTIDDLNLRNQFLLTLMKLRLNTNDYDLAFRFNVSVEYVTHILNVWLPMLGKEFQCLLQFPDPVLTETPYPSCFKEFTSQYVAAIVDFVEVPMPRTLETNKKRDYDTASEGMPAVRALVAYAPSGAVMFVSHFQPGGRRLKYVFQDSGFFARLEASLQHYENFPVTVICGRAAHIKWPDNPNFRLSAPPEPGSEARAVFERIVRRTDEFAVLRSEFPAVNLPYLEHMLTVCAALINIQCDAAAAQTDASAADQQELLTQIHAIIDQ